MAQSMSAFINSSPFAKFFGIFATSAECVVADAAAVEPVSTG
jgi:hypothetical protein